MERLYKNWPMHNIIAHPIMEILTWIGLIGMAEKLHDATLPHIEEAQRQAPLIPHNLPPVAVQSGFDLGV